MADQNEYEVGYKKPPQHTRWKVGQSGNPKGRPKKIKEFEKLLDIELSKEITITEGGQTVRVSKRELILKTLVHDAVKGDKRALKMLLPYITEHKSITGFESDAADRAAFIQLLSEFSEADDDQHNAQEDPFDD